MEAKRVAIVEATSLKDIYSGKECWWDQGGVAVTVVSC